MTIIARTPEALRLSLAALNVEAARRSVAWAKERGHSVAPYWELLAAAEAAPAPDPMDAIIERLEAE